MRPPGEHAAGMADEQGGMVALPPRGGAVAARRELYAAGRGTGRGESEAQMITTNVLEWGCVRSPPSPFLLSSRSRTPRSSLKSQRPLAVARPLREAEHASALPPPGGGSAFCCRYHDEKRNRRRAGARKTKQKDEQRGLRQLLLSRSPIPPPLPDRACIAHATRVSRGNGESGKRVAADGQQSGAHGGEKARGQVGRHYEGLALRRGVWPKKKERARKWHRARCRTT